MNNSSTGGPLVPTSAAPAYDDAFDGLLHDLIVGVVGLPGDMVRPRWQPVTPKQPEPTVDWCAIGVMDSRPLSITANTRHDPAANAGLGGDNQTTWEWVNVLASFYGPHAQGNAALFHDGLRVDQNREALFLAGVSLQTIGHRRNASSIYSQQVAVRRIDAEVEFTRAIHRSYAVYNLVQAPIALTYQAGGGNRKVTENFSARGP